MHCELPILYSFRRCPYAIRARMAISVSGQTCALREVFLRNKPLEMIRVSPKGTVPVLVLPGGRVIEESLEIMRWALDKNDPEGWLTPLNYSKDTDALITENDGPFKHNLDRYKYPTRYKLVDPLNHRTQGLAFLQKLNTRLLNTDYLCGNDFTFADAAISPFIRQFANNDREWFDVLDLSGLQRWLHSIIESTQFLNVMDKYPAWETGMGEPSFPTS
ncbi:MAG: glutathione S-transferase [Magnetovibrio sp.]|nr:glutathione S-transferase [Magnetovibrio sp.]